MLGEHLVRLIEKRRDAKRKGLPGELGRFWRDGGNDLLYDLPIAHDSVVIDGGGYVGEWSKEIITRYGCRSEIYEPVREFANRCQALFARNPLVKVHHYGLGNESKREEFIFLDNSTSRYAVKRGENIQSNIIDVAAVVEELKDRKISCLKLNIEGDEYDVLERLLEKALMPRIGCLLVQFHRQPADYQSRYENIVSMLTHTHANVWSYYMMWEKWVVKGQA